MEKAGVKRVDEVDVACVSSQRPCLDGFVFVNWDRGAGCLKLQLVYVYAYAVGFHRVMQRIVLGLRLNNVSKKTTTINSLNAHTVIKSTWFINSFEIISLQFSEDT